MNHLTPAIQHELYRTARRRPASFLFTGPNDKGKAQAAEVLAAHYESYLFPIDLSRVVTTYGTEAAAHLQLLFSRAEKGGDLLFFTGADGLFASPAPDGVVPFFLQQLQSFKGVGILSLTEAPAVEGFTSVIDFAG